MVIVIGLPESMSNGGQFDFAKACFTASAKDTLLRLLTFYKFTFLLFDLLVAKVLYCGQGISSILHLNILQCKVSLYNTFDFASKE